MIRGRGWGPWNRRGRVDHQFFDNFACSGVEFHNDVNTVQLCKKNGISRTIWGVTEPLDLVPRCN